MEIIIAIVIICFGLAVFFNRKDKVAKAVESETSSDNGIKFVDGHGDVHEAQKPVEVVQSTEAPVVTATPKKAPAKPRAKKVVEETKPARKPRAKKTS